MSLLGFTCKIKQEGIHTWSEAWLTFIKPEGSPCIVIATIDNSVDIVEWKKAPEGLKKETWLKDYGEGTQVNWYNKIARSKEQLDKLKNIQVKENKTEWIESSVKEWLGL